MAEVAEAPQLDASAAEAAQRAAAEMARLREEAKRARPLKPYEISDSLRPRIDELDLWDNVAEMRDNGYTVIREAGPPELFDRLRAAIHHFSKTGAGGAACMLLGRDPAVDEVVTLPKILALAEASVGKGMRAGQMVGSILPKDGVGAQELHADQNWIPAPFPEHNCVTTFCVPCEGMTKAGGATRVVPGSASLRRHPTKEDREAAETICLECEKGDVAVWDGSVWHGGGFRKIDGVRTVLHATYQRMYTQPIDDYTYLLNDEEYVKQASPELLGLLGVDLFYGTATHDHMVDMTKFMRNTIWSKQ